MVTVPSLLLPILLSAVFVFFLSFVIHMVLPHHRSDFKRLPSEDQVMDALRPFNIPPGSYIMPHAGSPEAMRKPEYQEKFKRGPVAFMTFAQPGVITMGKSLMQWFLYCLLISVFAAYLTGRVLGPGAPYLSVFRFAGTTAFCVYGLGLWQNSIWYRRAWSVTFKHTLDGLLYALMTAGTFGWLWPK
jgi:hypothetical protein